MTMEILRAGRAWTLIGAAVLALGVGAMARRSADAPKAAPEEMRDAVAAPISPVMLGAARAAQPNTGYFDGPSGRRAEAENALLSSRMTKVSKAMHARAAKLRREAAAERALAVSAQ
jgi:hypothetical protein